MLPLPRDGTEAKSEITPGQVCGQVPADFDVASYATRSWKIASYRKDGDRIDLGGRTIEIIATPGHTPEAISLLDREQGLLFTGDTYYRGAIWLYRPETDLDAYGVSIRKLGALAPQLKIVLGAHKRAGRPTFGATPGRLGVRGDPRLHRPEKYVTG